jgi:hypothetical protein
MSTPALVAYSAPDLRPARTRAFIGGAAAIALSAIGGLINPTQFFFSYLIGFMLCLGVALGCMALMMVHHLTGGAWGVVIRRILEAAAKTLPIVAVMFVPIALGTHVLYLWARPEVVAADPIIQAKQLYLNRPFFFARAIFYFAAWIGVAQVITRWSRAQDETADPALARRMQLSSAAGLLVYGLTITFASFDWVMSLEPHWFSTIFGVLFMGGQGLGALAFVIAVAIVLAARPPMSGVITPAHLHDLAKLLLAFVMLWAYFNFSQFLIIWAGNLPEEIPYYMHRVGPGWRWIGLGLIVFHFAVPFLLLLSRPLKRDPGRLWWLAAGILVMRFVDLFFLIGPEAHPEGFGVHWLDLALPLGLAAVWLGVFLRQLGMRPLLPLHEPQLAEALEHGRHGH